MNHPYLLSTSISKEDALKLKQ